MTNDQNPDATHELAERERLLVVGIGPVPGERFMSPNPSPIEVLALTLSRLVHSCGGQLSDARSLLAAREILEGRG